MANWDSVKKSVVSAQDSMGSAAIENQKYLDSISGKVSQLNSAIEELSATVFNSNIIKFFVDFGTQGVKAVNSIVEATSPLGAAGIFGTIMAFKKNVGRGKNVRPSYSCFECADSNECSCGYTSFLVA